MTNLRAGGEKAALQNGGIVSVVVIIAVGVNLDGRREILVRAIGPIEAATFRTDFPRQLRRGGSTTASRSKPLG
jgi:transposase-like protein